MLQEEQAVTVDINSTETPSDRSISAFTFFVSDSLYAVESNNVLSVKDDLGQIKFVPVKDQAVLGVYKYLDTIVSVYDYASLIGVKSGQKVMKSLIEHLEAREVDHINWLDDLEKSIVEGVPFTKALDPHQCAFGKWYDNFETRDENLREILAQFEEPHKRIHSLAEKLLKERDAGKKDKALDQLRVERHTTLRRLRSLFSRARDQVQGAMRPVILFVTEDGTAPAFGIVVDEINDVIEYSENDVQRDIGISSKSEGNTSLFSGMYVKENGPDSIICNINSLMNQETNRNKS